MHVQMLASPRPIAGSCRPRAVGRGAAGMPLSRPAGAAPARRRGTAVVAPRASADGADDPYKVLGVPSNADSAAINRAYNQAKYKARGNDAAMARLEAAHSAVMMSALSARLQGGAAAAAADARFADRGQLFPWRARRADANRTMMMVAGALQALIVAATLVFTGAGTSTVVYSAVVGSVGNIMKLNAIFPPGSGPDLPASQRMQGAKNVGRGLALAVASTLAGCLFAFTLPDAFATALGRSMPYWFYESERVVLTLGAAVANWVMTSFYR